ncbi:hypothetical protein PanWU01x14_182950 [Parasponia andersonii]|uniref:Uncharacterized protein n=1 Tax=Parasponia andersonii TaxID=3476 RepID=A0A2P5C5F3_PARAD|nr:hypothetical protein PanWU01x14_182950 [Parasponia andersonii]
MEIGVHQYATGANDGSLAPALSLLSSPSSSTQVSGKYRQRALEKEKHRIDTLYGADDFRDMSVLLYKEDLFEDVRRATEMESFRSHRRSLGLFMKCFEFLKIIFSFKS